jgi:AbrB family looped-hinge helix DNA binding protein
MSLQTEIQIGPQGRIVIPAPLRKALDLHPGEILIAHVEQGCLIFEKPDAIKRRLKARFAHLPKDVSLADELIAERRVEAKKEDDA